MESLFPYSSVVGLVEKCLRDGGDDGSVLCSLSALLRHVPYRADLFSIYASLSASNKLKLKLVSYQLAIRNRDDNQLVLLFNQALKDLSHSCWNVCMLSLQFLFIPQFELGEDSLDKSVLDSSTLSFIKDSGTRRAALSALGYLNDWERWRDVICRLVCSDGDMLSCIRLLQVTLPMGTSSQPHSDSILTRLTYLLSRLDGFDETSSIILLDLLEVAGRHRDTISHLSSYSIFSAFLSQLEDSTQISSRLYFSILKFKPVAIFELPSNDAFCYHLLRQKDQDAVIATLLERITPELTTRVVTLLVNTESSLIQLALVKYHAASLTPGHLDQIWQSVQFSLISQSTSKTGPLVLSTSQLAVGTVCTVRDFCGVFPFFCALGQNFKIENYFLATLWSCGDQEVKEVEAVLSKLNLSEGNKTDLEVIMRNRGGNLGGTNYRGFTKFQIGERDQLSPQLAQVICDPLLNQYFSTLQSYE